MAEFKHIVRIANTDIKGEKQILYGLTKIQGVSIMFANAACRASGVETTKKIGDLTDSEANKLDEVITKPTSSGLPSWLLNRRNDIETGEDMHILSGDLKFTKEQDIKRLMKMKSYRGLRHSTKHTVRGQRTKSNFRRNKGKGLGVKKKK